jgi:DNA-binding response OmpR family regulator
VSPTVLVVDDEPKIREVLGAYLRREAIDVLEAATGADALRRALSGDTRPDVILLDVGLPDLDGLDVLRRIRQESAVHVILVTARAEETDKIIGLGVGADDYVTKPFSPREVVARVKAAVRREMMHQNESAVGAPAATAPTEVLDFEDLTIDRMRRHVEHHAQPIHLSALEFDLLAAMASAPGRVWSRPQLLEKVWGYDFFGDERVVDVHIRSLRKALGDDPNDPHVIATVRGVGYRFIPEPPA